MKPWQWKLMHSAWMGWLFTFGVLNWVAFLFIGLRLKQRKWLVWAGLYLLPLILFFLPYDLNTALGQNLNAVAGLLVFLAGFASLAHGFAVRKEYLMRMAAVEPIEERALAEQVALDHGPKVNLNAATRSELAALPGLDDVAAEIALEMRRIKNGFTSLEEFAQTLGLDAKATEALRGRVCFGVIAPEEKAS